LQTLLASITTELGVSVKIDVGEGEPVESALRRFKREVNKSGHMMELRHRRYFENSQEKIKRKVKEARMRKRLERMNKRKMNSRT
jgi:small subunit ribosomal protein S21